MNNDFVTKEEFYTFKGEMNVRFDGVERAIEELRRDSIIFQNSTYKAFAEMHKILSEFILEQRAFNMTLSAKIQALEFSR